MPKRPPTYGDAKKEQVRCVFVRLLEYANDEIEERYKIRVHWNNDQQVDIQTDLIALAALTGLNKEIVREALNIYLKDFLGILEDLRGGKTKGSEDWHFLLKLWYPKNQQDKNLQQFDSEWKTRRNAKPGVQRSQKSQPKITRLDNLPESGVIEFIGRGEELEKLHELLQQNQRVAIAAIAGMGGIGKTELALQYALQHREMYPGGICWLLGKAGDVGVQIIQLARTLQELNPPDDLELPQKLEFCWRRWREGNVLLVVDDVSDYREVKDYLQFPSSRFKALITTREKLQPPVVRFDLDVLKPLAALGLLKTLVGEERVKREPWTARKLCKWLGYLPLGLELVGRYLAVDADFSLGEMLEALEQEGLQNPALVDEPGEMTAERGVAAAFELSWRKLSENAQILGCLLSLFALAPIPWELVEAVDIGKGKTWKKGRHDLLKLHLVQHKSEGIYQLHPLLRRFFQDKLTELSQGEELKWLCWVYGENVSRRYKNNWLAKAKSLVITTLLVLLITQIPREPLKRAFCKVMVGVAKEIPERITLKEVAEISPKQPHIAEVAENLIEYVSDDDLIYPFLVNAQFYQDQGLYTQSLPWCQQCLEVTKKRLGEEHPDFATSLNQLAELYRFQGRYSEAEPLYRQALELRRQLLGEEHPDFATSLNNLALLYYYQGRYSEAEPIVLEAIKLDKQLLGERNPDLATSMHNLASIYRGEGRYDEAEQMFLKALELKQLLLPEDHPLLADIIYALGFMYKVQERYEEAEIFSLQALDLDRNLLGEEHPNFAKSLNNLAEIYHSQQRYSEAESLYQQALEICENRLGENHPDTVAVRENLAELRAQMAVES